MSNQTMTRRNRLHHPGRAGYGTGSRVLDVVLYVFGAMAAFLGLFVLLGPSDQYLGLGGDLSWKVADIHAGWGYGLLAAGLVLLAAGLFLTLRMRRAPSIPTSSLSALVVHAGVFAGVNAILWFQDVAQGGGLDYAYWVTTAWGVGLLAHAAGYVAERRRHGGGAAGR